MVNIFVTDADPVKSAQSLDDKRIGKALMEMNQLLTIAINEHHPKLGSEHYGEGRLCQGLAYMNHPPAIWVRQNRATFDWALQHALGLKAEWEFRFGTEHASGARTPYIAQFIDCLPPGQMLPFSNTARNKDLGIDFTYLPAPTSYRHYLNARWKRDKLPVTFTGRGQPEWARFMT